MTEQHNWETIMQFAFLLTLLGVSLIIKSVIPFFKRHLMPTALFGGFIGLLLGPEVLGLVPFDRIRLENMVYHFMAIGFIALALKKRKRKTTENITNTGFAIVNTYIWQAALGLGITLLLLFTVMPQLNPNFGLLLPLSYAQGPGQALAIGKSLEQMQPAAKALENGGNIGLSMATFGFLWAVIGGIPFMHYLRKKYRIEKAAGTAEPTTSDAAPDVQEHTGRVPISIYLDNLTIQAVLIGVCYLLTFLLLSGLEKLLGKGSTLMTLFWGFQFMFGTLIALGVRAILNVLSNKGIVKADHADNYLLQRISSAAFDIMIVASVSAISLAVLGRYLVPVLILSTVGGLFTMIYSVKIAKWLYREEQMEHTVALYGMWTGTVVTAMALLKEIDPDGKTNVPESLVLGSGFGAVIGIPLMMVLSVPIAAWIGDNYLLYAVTFGIFAVYSCFCLFGIRFSKKLYLKARNKYNIKDSVNL